MIEILDGNEALNAELIETVGKLGPQVVPSLISLVADLDLMNEDSRGQGYIPVIASELLAEMGEVSALVPMLDVLLELDSISETYSRIRNSIIKLGEENWETIANLYDNRQDKESKARISDILAQFKVRDDRIFMIHLEQLIVGHGLSPSNLVIYGDPKALPYLSQELDKVEVSTNTFLNMHLNEIVHAIKDLGGSLTESQLVKDNRAEAVRAQLFGPIEKNAAIPFKKAKLGRNNLCSCGSGKKYKKCCLSLH